MNKNDAYKYGISRGMEAVRYTDFDPSIDESLTKSAHETEENSRQYSDFVNGFANEVVSEPDYKWDFLWESYNQGVAEGIRLFIRDVKFEPPSLKLNDKDLNDFVRKQNFYLRWGQTPEFVEVCHPETGKVMHTFKIEENGLFDTYKPN